MRRRPCRVIVVAFEDVQTLDVTGPGEVFAAASRARGRAAYRVELASSGGGLRSTSSAMHIATKDLRGIRPHADDIVIVAGGEETAIRAAIADRLLLKWLTGAARIVRRMASVCSGAFILAAAGLLDGRRAATHWSGCDRLAQLFPRVIVDRNAIYVVDGKLWTSAGVTTGIDMALAMVEQDLGRGLADAVAARLVLHARRLGFQSQFSDALVAQLAMSDPLGPAIAWARAHLREVDVEELARRAALSVRTLHRRCIDRMGTTPAKLVEKLRVEQARTLLTTTNLPAKTLADQCGFGSAARMKRAFERELGMGAREFRMLRGQGER
jgi:transcriptional regulator GlxA family with amidase domain